MRGHTRRWWSARRIPAALLAAAVLICAGLLLFEVVSFLTGVETAERQNLADELASRPINDVWILTGATIAAALGLWLILLALTPGLRHLLPLRVNDDPIRTKASLDRNSAAQLLRDAAMQVPGVGRAKVRMGRHRVTVRAHAAFRHPAVVRDDLRAALLREERNLLGLAHPPRLKVRVRRPRK